MDEEKLDDPHKHRRIAPSAIGVLRCREDHPYFRNILFFIHRYFFYSFMSHAYSTVLHHFCWLEGVCVCVLMPAMPTALYAYKYLYFESAHRWIVWPERQDWLWFITPIMPRRETEKSRDAHPSCQLIIIPLEHDDSMMQLRVNELPPLRIAHQVLSQFRE